MMKEVPGGAAWPSGWLNAWRGRHDNPLAREDAWRAKGERAYFKLPVSVALALVTCSALATYLIFQSYQHFKALAPSACISRAYAVNTLLWAVVTLLDYAVAVCCVWLLLHLSCVFRGVCGFLARAPGFGARLGAELAASPIEDSAIVTGAGLRAWRVVQAPLITLAFISAADQLAAVCAKHQDLLFSPGSAGWPGAPWLWAVLAAALIALLKFAAGALTTLAWAWALLCLSAFWRNKPQPVFAWILAVLCQWLCIGVGWPGRSPFAIPGIDYVAQVFKSPAPAVLLGAGLVLLAVEAHLWQWPRAQRWLARRPCGELRTGLALGLLLVLLIAVGHFADSEAVYLQYYSYTKGTLPALRSMVPSFLWPLQAASVTCPIPALDQALSTYGTTAVALLKLLSARAALLLGFPLLLCAIFAGHARHAVGLARRGAV